MRPLPLPSDWTGWACVSTCQVPNISDLACRFDEARQAYAKAGKPRLATQILEQLSESSIVQNSFAEAAYYLYQLAMEALAVRTLLNHTARCAP